MELKVNAVSIPEAITFNYEELKAELLEKAAVYASVVYTEDQIREAKADRANLNRLKKALNDERLKREREYMKPFDDFKSKINEIIRIIDKPASIIDQQIKAAEERQKEQKAKEIHDYFISRALPDDFEINFAMIFEERWLNASVSMKSIQESIDTKIERIVSNLSVVRSLPSYAFEAEQAYKNTLDLAKAVSEAHRLQEMAEKKAAFEAEQARKKVEAEAEAIKPDPVDINPEQSFYPEREWIKFQAFVSVDEAKALGQYLRNHGIKYKAV